MTDLDLLQVRKQVVEIELLKLECLKGESSNPDWNMWRLQRGVLMGEYNNINHRIIESS